MTEMEEQKAPEVISADKFENFSKWYNDILVISGILDRRYDLKAMFVWLPYGIKAMRKIKDVWDELFEEADIGEAYFPLLVPRQYAQMNDERFEGFKNEAFWAQGGVDVDREEKYMLRPTGEPAIYPMFSKWVKTANDLPIRIYETVSSFRYESKQTMNLIRDREITFWYEIHTAHATKEESDKELELHFKINNEIWHDYLGIPAIPVEKPQWECFPGAVGAREYYTIMPNGRLLENGSINHLGQAYAKKFNIMYIDENEGDKKYAWQICTGNGGRYLAAVIATHGDKNGLIFPPRVAPLPVMIIPIFNTKDEELTEKILKYSNDIIPTLKRIGIKAKVDDRRLSPGQRFYDAEIKGIPVRIEIGPKEFAEEEVTLFRRDTFKRKKVKMENLANEIIDLLNDIQNNLYERAKQFYNERQKYFDDIEKAVDWIHNGGTAIVSYCENESCWDALAEKGEGFELVGTLIDRFEEAPCIICGSKTDKRGVYGHSY